MNTTDVINEPEVEVMATGLQIIEVCLVDDKN